MARTREIVFELLELVDTTPGEWCPDCHLPSAMRVTLASQIKGRPLCLTVGHKCTDCGARF